MKEALLNELEFYIEGVLNNEYTKEEYKKKLESLNDKEKERVIERTIDDEQFTEEMFNCFDYYLNH